MKQVLITGGAGFIGSHLAQALVQAGVRVRVLDNFSTGTAKNLSGLPVEMIPGDVADYGLVTTAVTGCDVVFHLAALVSVPQSLTNPVLNQRTNVTGTFNVLEAARRTGIRRVVYTSSSAVYGNLPDLPRREDSPVELLSPYAAAKYVNEVQAAMYRRAYGLECIGLRLMNVYGPRQDASSPYSGVLSLFCLAALQGDGVTIYGSGMQTRDFVYVSDVVAAYLLAAEVSVDNLPADAVFNIGRGEQSSLREVLALLEEIGKRPLPVTYAPQRPGDVVHSVADISRAAAVLGFEPRISLEDGLTATLRWLRTRPDGR